MGWTIDQIGWVKEHEQDLAKLNNEQVWRYIFYYHPYAGWAATIYNLHHCNVRRELPYLSLDQLSQFADAVTIARPDYAARIALRTHTRYLPYYSTTTALGNAAYLAIYHPNVKIAKRFGDLVKRWQVGRFGHFLSLQRIAIRHGGTRKEIIS